MYTQCPNCDTLFRITVPQLKAAQGKVRCGHCDNVFNALLNLTEQPPQALPVLQEVEPSTLAKTVPKKAAGKDKPQQVKRTVKIVKTTGEAQDLAQPEQENAQETATGIEPIMLPDKEATVGRAHGAHASAALLTDVSDFKFLDIDITGNPFDRDRAPSTDTEDVDDTNEHVRLAWEQEPASDREPEEAEDRRETHHWLGTVAWALAILALLVLLMVQYAYFRREDLARYDALRPGLETLCALTGTACNLPLRRDLTQIKLLSRQVRTHPTVQDALLITAVLINKAAFPQTYPVLQVSLSDANGAAVAMRRFQPAEYLAPNTDIKSGMKPHTSVPITLELTAPNADLASASWDFALY